MPESVTKDSPAEIQYPPSIGDDVAKLVQRVQTFTGATGAAIALRDGEDMICRASRGTNAPDVGVMLNLDGTFTGLAVTGMKAVRCDDTENDSRVDPEISRSLRIKSMAVVPVLSGMRVSGVIAVFSGINNAFSDTHMAVLKTMADGLGANILRWCESQGISLAAPVASNKPQLSPISAIPAKSETVPPPAAPEVKVIVVEPPVVKAEPAPAKSVPVAAPSAAAAAPAPEKSEPSPAKKQDSKPQSKWKPVPAKQEEPAPVVESKPVFKSEPKAEAKIAPPPSFNFESPEASQGSKTPMLIGIVAVVVIAIAVGGYFMFGRSSKTSSTPAATASTSQPVSTTPAATAPSTAAAAPATGASKTSDPTKPAADKTKASQIADDTTVSKPLRAPMVVASPTTNSSKAADVAPPTLALGSGGPSIDVPVTTSAPKLAAPAPANAVVVPSHLVQRVNPTYPTAARQYRVEGAVTLDATIGADGRVKEAKVMSGPSMLRESAVSAVRQWKYSPSTVNGRAVESNVQIVLQFKMP